MAWIPHDHLVEHLHFEDLPRTHQVAGGGVKVVENRRFEIP
jgi:hypothetical protein